jgi:hypothetical protein
MGANDSRPLYDADELTRVYIFRPNYYRNTLAITSAIVSHCEEI